MLARRSLNGSMTVVGDLAQSTATWTPKSWDELEQQLTPTRAAQRVELTVSYRTPAEVIEMATPVLKLGAAEIEPPVPVRRAGVRPQFVLVEPGSVLSAIVEATSEHVRVIGEGRVAVLIESPQVSIALEVLCAAGIDAVDPKIAGSRGLSAPVVVVPIDEANGLEFDAVTLVEPMDVACLGASDGADMPTIRGLRTLYVAMTRPTRRLTLVATKRGPIDFSAWSNSSH
jgi:DNA helicase IV